MSSPLPSLCKILKEIDPMTSPLSILHHLQKYPGSINEIDDEGFNPVHIACSYRHPLEVIRAVATANLETLNHRSILGTIPLHTAVFRKCSIEVIKSLIESNPGALSAEKSRNPTPLTEGGPKVQCGQGWLPLHYACGYAASSREVVMVLYHLHSSGLLIKDKASRTPFHWACEFQQFEIIYELLSFDKQVLEMKDENERLPISYLIHARAWDVEEIDELIKCVKIFYKTYPESILMKDKWGFTAANLAHQLQGVGSITLIKALEKRVDTSGETTRWEFKTDNEWSLFAPSASCFINEKMKEAMPIFSLYHFGAQYKIVIKTRISGKCVKVDKTCGDVDVDSYNDDLDRSRTHKPFEMRMVDTSEDKVKAEKCPLLCNLIIQERWEDAMKVLNLPEPNNGKGSTIQGNNVLHLSCRHSAPLEVLKKIIEMDEDTLKQPNAENQQLPLHVIILNNANVEAIKLIVNEYTKAAEIMDKDGNFPLHLCIAREDIKLVQIICNFNWNATGRRNKDGRLPYDLVLARGMGEVFKGVTVPDEDVFDDKFWPVRVGDVLEFSAPPLCECKVIKVGEVGDFEVEEEGVRKTYDIYKEGKDPRFMRCRRKTRGGGEEALFASPADPEQDPIVEFDAATRNFNHAGGVLKTRLGSEISLPTNGRPTRLKMVEVDKNGEFPELIIPNTPTNYATSVLKFEGRDGIVKGGNGEGVTVRLPTNNIGDGSIRAWSEDADGVWKEIDEKNVAVNDYYASIKMDTIPHMLTATCDSCVYSDCSVLGFASKPLNKVVVCVVPRGADEREICLKVLDRKGFVLVDEGFDELRVKKGEEIHVKIPEVELEKAKTFMDKRLSFEFSNEAMEEAGVKGLGSKGLLGFKVSRVSEDDGEDEVELSIGHETFNIPDLTTLVVSAPLIASRSSQSIMFKCSELDGELKTLCYEFRLASLSIKDELENGFFIDVKDVEEEKWSMVGGLADPTVFSVGGIYACYCQCRLKHEASGRVGAWSGVLFVPPPNRRRTSIGSAGQLTEASDSAITSPLSLLTPSEAEAGSSGNSLTFDQQKLLEIMSGCKVAKESAKVYSLCCYTLSKKVFFILKELQRSGVRVSEEVFEGLEAAVALIKSCGERGWLEKLVLPPTPGWGSRFIEADENLVRCFMNCGGVEWAERFKQTELVNVSHLDYLDDFSFDYNGLARDHFIQVWKELEGDEKALEERIADFCLDFNCSYEEFSLETKEEGLRRAMRKLDMGGGAGGGDGGEDDGVSETVLAVGSPRSAINAIREGGQGKVSVAQTIFISGVAREAGHEMDAFRRLLRGKGFDVVCSTDDLRSGGLDFFESVSKEILGCGVFVVFSSESYGRRKLSKQTFSELESAVRFGKTVAIVGGGGALDTGLQERVRSAKFFACLDNNENRFEKLLQFFSTLGINGGGNGEREEVASLKSSLFSEDSMDLEAARNKMEEDVRAWLHDNRLGIFVDPLQEYGVRDFQDLFKLTDQSTWGDLEAMVGDKRVLKRFLKKLNLKNKSALLSGPGVEGRGIVAAVLEVAISIIKSAEDASKCGVMTAELYAARGGMARDYLQVLGEKCEVMKQPILGMVERYVGEIHRVLRDLDTDLKRTRSTVEEEAGGDSLINQINRLVNLS
ncbi:hypothetical protein TrST_g1262 [Triparma strigata]|uniref:Uncharacterized protein n=1 Tax=Triparma strigata TaxID=1606541 RepID=A0A9W6ZJN1_9STRA|nr:hypothetical protein TrST_g1262 [Triparma strigata]